MWVYIHTLVVVVNAILFSLNISLFELISPSCWNHHISNGYYLGDVYPLPTRRLIRRNLGDDNRSYGFLAATIGFHLFLYGDGPAIPVNEDLGLRRSLHLFLIPNKGHQNLCSGLPEQSIPSLAIRIVNSKPQNGKYINLRPFRHS